MVPAARPSRARTGRRLLRAVAGLTAVGGFAADWNRTHLFNPAWPPHARFHDAFTISLGTMLGGAGLWSLRSRDDGAVPRSDLVLGAVLPAMFWAAQGTAFLYPGAEGLEAEQPQLVPRVRGVWVNERFASAAMLLLGLVGYLLARRGDGERDGAPSAPVTRARARTTA